MEELISQLGNIAYRYGEGERPDFDAYIESRLSMIDVPQKDEAYLRERLYEMYNNPVINHQKSLKFNVESL